MTRIDEILARRGARLESRTLEATGSDVTLADHFITALGLLPLGPAWRPLAPDVARAVVRALAECDLAYRSPVLAPDEADILCAAFFECVSDDARFLTNGGLAEAHAGHATSAGWQPLLGATFDTGVIAVGGGRVVMIWFADED